jgi:type IV pilus assembly protein PilA
MKSMKMMKKAQQGFTLIELMIVVAIIGILAAIALPAYQDYTAKAQASEAASMLDSMKTPIELALADGACPANASAAVGEINKASDITGTYVASVTIAGTAPTCTVTIAMKTTGVNSKIAGKTVTYTRTGGTGGTAADANIVSYTCSVDSSVTKYFKGCTTAAAATPTPAP